MYRVLRGVICKYYMYRVLRGVICKYYNCKHVPLLLFARRQLCLIYS